ncbi:myosin-10-like isoform X2 [Bacillus rossius redtenbacheri]
MSNTNLGSNASQDMSSLSASQGRETGHDSESARVVEDLKQSLVENFKTIKLLEKKLTEKDQTIRDYETGRAQQSSLIEELRENLAVMTETMALLQAKPQIGLMALGHPPRPVRLPLDGQEPAHKTISRGQSLTEPGLIVPEYRGESGEKVLRSDSSPHEESQVVEQYKQKIARQALAVCELSESLAENVQTVKKLKVELEEKNESIQSLKESSENQALVIDELKASLANYLKEVEQAGSVKEYENNVLSELNAKLEDKEKTVKDLEKRRQEMENVVEGLRDNLSEESQKNQVLHNEVIKLSLALEKLEAAVKKEQTQTIDGQVEAETSEMIAKLEEELDQKVIAVRVLQEEREKCLDLITELKHNLENTSSELSEANFELKENCAYITELEQTKKRLEKLNEELISSSQNPHMTNELTEKLKLQNERVKELLEKNSEAEIELKNLNEKLIFSLEEIERFEKKEQDLHLRLEHAGSVTQEHEELSKTLQMRLDEQALIIDDLRPQILELQHKHGEEIAEKQDLVQSLRYERELASERSANLEAEVKDNLQVIQELQLEREHQIRINEELKEELTQQASIVQGLQDDLARITQDSVTVTLGHIAVQDFQSVMKRLNKSDKEDVTYTLEDVERSFNIKEDTITKLTEEKNSMLSRIQDLEDELREAKNRAVARGSDSELEACKLTISEQEERLRANDRSMEELRGQLSALKRLQDALSSDEDVQKLEAKLHLYRDKLSIEERKVKEYEKQLLAQEFVLKEGNRERAGLSREVEELRRAVQDGESRVANLTGKLERAMQGSDAGLPKEVEELRRAVQDGESRVANLTEQLERATQESDAQRQQASRAEELAAECVAKGDTIARLQKKMEGLENQLRDSQSARNTVELLEDQMARRLEKIQQLQKTEDMHVKTIASLEIENKLLCEQLSDLRRELSRSEQRSRRASTEQPPREQASEGNGYLVSFAVEKVLEDPERTEGQASDLSQSLNSRIYKVRVEPELAEVKSVTTSPANSALTNGMQTESLEAEPPASDLSWLDPEFDKYSKYPIASLKRRSELLPPDVNILRKEVHLSRQQFVDTFGIKWEEFAKLPGWKQQTLKKKVGLF